MPRTVRTAFALLAALLASCSLSGTGVDGDEGSIAIALARSLASGSAGCLKAGIPNGHYTLLLKLLDRGVGSVAVSITPRNGFTVN